MIYLNMAHNVLTPPRCYRIQRIVGIFLCLSSMRCRWHHRNGGAAISMCGSVDCCVFALIFVIVEWLHRGGMIHFTSPLSMAVMCRRSYIRRRIVVVNMPMPPMPSMEQGQRWYDADGWLLYAWNNSRRLSVHDVRRCTINDGGHIILLYFFVVVGGGGGIIISICLHLLWKMRR